MNFKPSNRRITPGQLSTLRAIPETPDAPITPAKLKVAASEYVDPKRFEFERQVLFLNRPIVVAASASLPQPGSYMRQDVLGIPLIITRAKDGSVSAFLNVCSHRGIVLCPNREATTGNLITCPYHAWSFGLDGELKAVPRPAIFDDLDKGEHALRRVACVEAGGLIWAQVRSERPADFTNVTGALKDDLDAFGLGDMHLFKKNTYNIHANWKLIMDSMLDTYHVIRLHKDTLAKFFVDWPTVTERVGPHLRSAGARENFIKAALTDDLDVVREMSVLTYNIFPNGIVVLSPGYISVAIMRPLAFDRTEVEYLMLSDVVPQNASDEKKLEQSFALMDAAFGNEDFWAAELGQEGLATGAYEYLTLGGMEVQMRMFHDIIDEQLSLWRAA